MALKIIGMMLIAFFPVAAFPGPARTGTRKAVKWHPGHYALPFDQAMFAVNKESAAAERFERFVASLPDEITGVQGGAYWRMLEPEKDKYDFSLIEKQLRICARHKKYFFCTVSEKQFSGGLLPVPNYLLNDPEYRGGTAAFKDGRGSQARIWDPAVLARFNKLVAALGGRFDKEPYFEGIEFVETALNIDFSGQKFSPADYLGALKERLTAAKRAFPSSVVLQEVNWLPGAGRREMADFFRFCRETGAGAGGPDLIPDAERVQERPRIPAYEFFPEYAGKMPLASDVQSPQYQGRFGNKLIGALTPEGIYEMGVTTLKLNYIFWGVCDWNNTNFKFSKDVLPLLRRRKGGINTKRPANLN